MARRAIDVGHKVPKTRFLACTERQYPTMPSSIRAQEFPSQRLQNKCSRAAGRSEMDTWACTALSDVNIADASGFDQCPSPLGTDYRDQRLRNAELERAVQELREKVDGEVHKRQVVDFDRELAIDALREKTEEVRQRDETIDAQNALLSLAWADAQDLASSHQSTQDALQLLKEYIEGILASTPDPELNANKKRRLCS